MGLITSPGRTICPRKAPGRIVFPPRFMHPRPEIDIQNMRFDPQAGVTRPISNAATRRQRGRIEQESLMSNLGPVLDVSASGVRILARRVPKGEVSVQLIGLGGRFELRGRVIWSHRIGLRKHEIGIEFDDITPEMSRHLTRLATDNRLRRVG